MNADELATRVAEQMLAQEGTGRAWGITIDEVREDYARVSMPVRADRPTPRSGAETQSGPRPVADQTPAYPRPLARPRS